MPDPVDQAEELRHALKQSEEYFSWGLPRSQARLLTVLLRREKVSKDLAYLSIHHDRHEADRPASDRDVSVYLSHLRSKLRPFNITILTDRGFGWHIPTEDKKRALELFEAVKSGTAAQNKLFKKFRREQNAKPVRLELIKPSQPFVFKIDKNIPLPPPPGGGHTKYRFTELEIGDSFLVPGIPTRVMNSACQTFRKKHKNFWFAVRSVEGGVRVWRVEPPDRKNP